jgi:hypothetical protein
MPGVSRAVGPDSLSQISSALQLEQWFDKLTGLCRPESPGIFRLRVHGSKVDIAFGLAESFVSLEHESGMPPYFTTPGNPPTRGRLSSISSATTAAELHGAT